MPVPSTITDLSTTAGSNSPAGTDAIGTALDNYLQAHASFLAQLRDGSKNLALSTSGAPTCAFTGDSDTGVFSPAANSVGFSAGNAVWYNNAGIWLNPSVTQPHVVASRITTGQTSGNTVIFNSAAVNRGTILNTSTGIFTAPMNGSYFLSTSVLLTNAALDRNAYCYLKKNGSADCGIGYGNSFIPVALGGGGVSVSGTCVLAATDTIEVVCSDGTGSALSATFQAAVGSTFTAYLLG